jgi:hypothetical protein
VHDESDGDDPREADVGLPAFPLWIVRTETPPRANGRGVLVVVQTENSEYHVFLDRDGDAVIACLLLLVRAACVAEGDLALGSMSLGTESRLH